MRPLPIERMVGSAECVLGGAIVRGRVLPVVDLAALLGEGPSDVLRFVSLRVHERGMVLAVGSVQGVTALDWTALRGASPLLTGRDGVASAIGILDRDLLLVLAASRLLPPALNEGASA